MTGEVRHDGILSAADAPGLEEDGDDDEEEAEPEGWADFVDLVEEDGGDDDAVDGLQVVSQVDREGGQLAQGLQLKQEGDDREHGAEQQQGNEIPACRHDGRIGQQPHISMVAGIKYTRNNYHEIFYFLLSLIVSLDHISFR